MSAKPKRKAASRPSRKQPIRIVLLGEGGGVLRRAAEAVGLTVVDAGDPCDLVVTYGGDGSLLGAERDFPDVPKMPIRRGTEYDKCARHTDHEVFSRVAAGTQSITTLPRLQVTLRGKTASAINDIVLHNAKVTSGVRYRIRIDDEPYSTEIVGDGVVVATPFGSSAYYRSITNSVIRVGIGIAFNNSTEAVTHLVVREDSRVYVEVTRGPAVLVGDNQLEPFNVERGDVLCIQQALDQSVIWELETLTCLDCRSRLTGKPAGFRHV